MPVSPLGPHAASGSEIKERIAADRARRPYLVYRDGENRQVIRPLGNDDGRLSLGRSQNTHVSLPWDAAASWTHALLEPLGDDWVILDDGLSTHGTFVNGERIRGQRRLRHDDLIQIGSTILAFQAAQSRRPTTLRAARPPDLTEAQRRVLLALCRPYGETRGSFETATNEAIAHELHLSVATVKNHHMKTLFKLFEIGEAPQSKKRARLMQRAFETGAISFNDYRPS